MPIPPSTIVLSREERRALARQGETFTSLDCATLWEISRKVSPLSTVHQCLFCLAPLANGRAVCSDACDEAAWRLVPTIDGELYGVAVSSEISELKEPAEPPKRRALTPAERQRRRREKIRAEREMQPTT